MSPTMVSFNLVLHKLLENVSFLYLHERKQGLWFLKPGWYVHVIPVQNLKTKNHFEKQIMVSMETKFTSEDSILDKLSEKYLLE